MDTQRSARSVEFSDQRLAPAYLLETNPLSLPVLVLNRVYQPVRITAARAAIRMLYTGVAQALDTNGDYHDFDAWLRLPVRAGIDDRLGVISGSFRVPRIVHLCRYATDYRRKIRLCARNIMIRDRFVCQYCGLVGSKSELDIDHVMPKSRGGPASWANLVTSCVPCNRRKGHRTPQEAAMPLLRRPQRPGWSRVAQLLATASRQYDEWVPFLKVG